MASWDWAWWFGGGLAAAAGLWIFVRAMFADRARGRRRCPRCWYDMAGLAGLKCPECGRTAKRERQLRRTRRRWGRAVLGAALAVIGISLAYTPRAMRLGWPGAVPTFVVAPLARWLETKNGLFVGELARRCGARGGEQPMWIDRIALAWYGEYLVNHPRGTGPEAQASAGNFSLWAVMPAHVNRRIGFTFLIAARAQGRSAYEKLRDIWRTDLPEYPPRWGNGYGETLDWERFKLCERSADAKYTIMSIAVADADRHGLLSDMLADRDPLVRAEAAGSLGSTSLGSPPLDGELALALVTRAMGDSAPRVRVRAAQSLSLSTIRNDGALPLLERAIGDVDSGVAMMGVDVLIARPRMWDEFRPRIEEIARQCNDVAFERLIRGLPITDKSALYCQFVGDERAGHRAVVLRLLSGFGPKAAGCHDEVLRVLKQDEDESCRFYATHALGWMCTGKREDREALAIAARDDVSERVRGAAVESSLLCRGVADERSIALGALKDPAPSVRIAAVSCLAALAAEPERAIAEIVELRNDPSEEVRRVVEVALTRLERRLGSGGAKKQ